MRLRIIVTTSLAACVIATPLYRVVRSISVSCAPSSLALPTEAKAKAAAASIITTSAASTCTAGDNSTTDGVQAILVSTGAIDWLDIMFHKMPNGESDWVNHIRETVFPDQGASTLAGCGDIGGDCDPDSMCSDYSSLMAYWVFRSVGVLHSKFIAVHEQLLWDGSLDGLSIDQIAKDFSGVSPDQSRAKWIAVAFTMAGVIATGIDLSMPLRGMIGFASAGLTDVSLTSSGSDSVDVKSVKNTLRNIVGAAGNYDRYISCLR